MRWWFLFLLFVLLPSVLAGGAVNVSEGVMLFDGFFEYRVNVSSLGLSNLSVSEREVFLDGVSFCSSGLSGSFFTLRDCFAEWEFGVLLSVLFPIAFLVSGFLFWRSKNG